MVSPSATVENYPVNFPYRTRFAVHPRACSIGGGSFASSSDGSRAVVAGNDVLRLIKISDTSRQTDEHLHLNARLCVGPGGATIETSPNMWPSSGLKVDSAPTDVIWGKGAFDNKVVTSARNGEIIYWDVSRSGNKFDGRVREHKRAINQLAPSSTLPYMFVSGSQDGYLRIWDFRSPVSSVLKVYHAAGIRTLALCPVSSHPMHVCVGLESGTIQRWDLRSKAQPLERVTLAHSSAVLSMDWQSPSMNESGLGWIVTSGMDRSVKIWDLTNSGTNITIPNDNEKSFPAMKMGGNGPIRTLHPSFIGRHVKWRQGSNTEVAIVSNTDVDSDSIVEIWDIRRGWIGKWALQHGAEGVEGSVTDLSFASENILHTLHTSGAFVQYDLHHSLIKPLDAIPRNSLAWTATGEMAFVAGLKDEHEIPFDHVEDFNDRTDHAQYDLKAITDPPYIPTDQTFGVLSIVKGGSQDMSPEFNTLLGIDANRITRLAKRYIFRLNDMNGDRKEICIANAEVAESEGDDEAVRVWNLLATLLNDDDVRDESAANEIENQPSCNTPPSQPSLLPLPESSRSMSITLNHNAEGSQAETTGHISASPSIARPTITTITVSSSPDNQSSTLTGHSQEKIEDKNSNHKQKDPQMSPVSMYDASISSAGLGDPGGSESVVRRSPVFPSRPRPDFRRESAPVSSTPVASSRRSVALSRSHLGGGALDSLDDENDDDTKAEGSGGATHHTGTYDRSGLTGMMEKYRKLKSDGSIRRVSEEDLRGKVSPGLMTRSTSAKSFSESSKINLSMKSPYPGSSLSAIQDDDYQKLSTSKSGSASTSSSSSKMQMSKGRQTRPSASLSSSSSSLSKPVSQRVLKLPHISSMPPPIARVRSAKAQPTPSPLSRVFTPQSRGNDAPITSLIHAQRVRTVSPNEHFSDDEEERGSSESESHSDMEEIVSDTDSDLEVEDGSDDSSQGPPSRSLARSNSVPIPSSVPRMTDSLSWNAPRRTPSKSSIRTVTVAVPSRPPSVLSNTSRRYAENKVEEGDQASTSERITVTQESLTSTRRPSPSPAPAPSNIGLSSAGTGLGLVNVTNEESGGGDASLFNVSIHRLRPINLAVPSWEKKWRDIVWKEMRKNFERLSENGDVQMCAMLAILVPKELKLRKTAIRRSIEAYIELLSRLRQHILAAHVRKYTEVNLTEQTGQVAIYSACGRCNTSIKRTSRATLLCSKCKSQPNHCAICHLPVHKLFIHCPICEHGGHETCYRSYMASHSAMELPVPSTAISLFSNAFGLFHTQSSNSLSGSSLGSSVAMEDTTSTYYSFSETASGGETSFEEEDSDLTAGSNPTGSEHGTDILRKTRLGIQSKPIQIWGHACPAGCGHWCWGTNISVERNEVLTRL